KTSRDDVVVDIDRARLVRRMEQYFDPAISHEEMRRIAPGAMQSTARFQAEAVRDQLRKRGFRPENIVRYCYRPFDVRWLYWEAVAYLSYLAGTAEELFYHTLAVLHAPIYRTENAGALRQDWPRVPLPGTAELLRASAALGRQVAALLDPERPVPGVTSGKLRP